jgi:hypothetical protein
LAVEAVIGEPVSASHFPVPRDREILAFRDGHGYVALAFPNGFKAFPPNSLRIKTGNFTD